MIGVGSMSGIEVHPYPGAWGGGGYHKGLPEGSSRAPRGGAEIPRRTEASKA